MLASLVWRRFCSSTVFALSTAAGRAAVAVIRITGSSSLDALKKLAKLDKVAPNKMYYRPIFDAAGRLIDRALVVGFVAPTSFTGENCAEIHCHGNAVIIGQIYDALRNIGITLAEPGEFTRRAFLNGKLDLMEVEALADLINAQTIAQHRFAVQQLSSSGSIGPVAEFLGTIQDRLVSSLAQLEAWIDFSEDELIEDHVYGDVIINIRTLLSDMELHVKRFTDATAVAEKLRHGARAVIVGEPNVGKSSLLNLLCRRQAAIVSPVAGTTRDVIETSMEVGGFPVNLADLAGIRNFRDLPEIGSCHSTTADEVETEGIKRALHAAKNADLLLLVADGEKVLSYLKGAQAHGSIDRSSVLSYFKSYLVQLGLPSVELGASEYLFYPSSDKTHSQLQNEAKSTDLTPSVICIINKYDLVDQFMSDMLRIDKDVKLDSRRTPIVWLSCKDQTGLDDLRLSLTELLSKLFSTEDVALMAGEEPMLTTQRQIDHLRTCCSHLRSFIELVQESKEPLSEHSEFVVSPKHSQLSTSGSVQNVDHNLKYDDQSVIGAHHLRMAVRALGQITGAVHTEQVLDVLFSKFCIGK